MGFRPTPPTRGFMKTLIFDIEIFHTYNEAYQNRMYTGFIDTGVRMSADVSSLAHFGYKWLGSKRALCKDLTDFDMEEKKLVEFASGLFQQADHLVAHYGDKFDRRYMNAKLLQYGFPPIPPAPILKQTDTCKLARQHLKISSNKLDNLARFLKVSFKRSKSWPHDWLLMTKGEKAAFKRVKTYCIGDIIALEEVYKKLISFSNSPNLAVRTRKEVCPKCGLGGMSIKYGSFYTLKKVHPRFRCKSCSFIYHEGQLVK